MQRRGKSALFLYGSRHSAETRRGGRMKQAIRSVRVTLESLPTDQPIGRQIDQ